MSVAALTDVDTAARPVRIPKLAVRNRTYDDSNTDARPATATTVGTDETSENGGQTRSESSSLRAPSSGGGRRLSDQSGSGSSGLARRDGTHQGSSVMNKTMEPAKKKKSGMLGFLTMKEPSAMALEQFAEAERRKAQEKGSAMNLSGVSSRKLPEHVPKVNSKWDGLPETANKNSAEGRSVRSRGNSNATATSGRRPSTYSSWSNRSDEGKRPIGSLSSRPPQSPQLLQRSSLQSRGTVSSTHSARAPILNNDIHPAFRPIAVEETPENLPQTFLHPPSPPRMLRGYSPPQKSPRERQNFTQELPATFGAVPELDTSDGPLPELESSFAIPEMDALRSKEATPIPGSPMTPSMDDAYAANYYSDSIVSSHGGHGDVTTTFFHSQSDTDHEDFAARSSTPKQLRQPINFSRRRTGKARPPSLGRLPEAASSGFSHLTDEPPILSSTLKNSDGRIDPFLTDTFAAHSRETGRIVERQAPNRAMHQSYPSMDEPIRASMSTYVSSNGIQSPVFSTAPTDSTRPSTAASHVTTGTTYEGPDAYYTTHVRQGSNGSMTPSLAPSTASAQWAMSPKERLGLGSKIRKGEVLPWETAEDLPHNAEVVPSISSRRSPVPSGMMSPSTPTDSKFRRLSRWGGKR